MFAWDENQLSLGKPACMDTPTLIEWIQRQLETEEETLARHAEARKDAGPAMLFKGSTMSLNEIREAWYDRDLMGRPMVLPSNVEVVPLKVDPTIVEYVRY